MRQPLHGNRLDERIGNNNFLFARRRRVAVERRFHVGLQYFADARQAVEKVHRQLVRGVVNLLFGEAGRRLVFQALADFVFQFAENRIQQRRRLHLDFRGVDQLFVKETGEQQPQQILRDGRDGALGRQVFAVQMVDAAHLRVGRDEVVGEFGNRIHGGKLPRSGAETKFLSATEAQSAQR